MSGKLLGEQLIMKSIAILYFCNVVELEKIQKRVTEMIMEMEELPNRERLKRLGSSAWRGEHVFVIAQIPQYGNVGGLKGASRRSV